MAAQAVYPGASRRMAASACRSPADRGTPTGPEGYREIAEVGVGVDAVRREPAPEAGARSGVEHRSFMRIVCCRLLFVSICALCCRHAGNRSRCGACASSVFEMF